MSSPKMHERGQKESFCQLKRKETVTQQVQTPPSLSGIPWESHVWDWRRGMGFSWPCSHVDHISMILKSFCLRDQFHNNTYCSVQSSPVFVCTQSQGFYRRETMCVCFYVEHVQYVIVFPVPVTHSGSGRCLRFSWPLSLWLWIWWHRPCSFATQPSSHSHSDTLL